LDCPQSCPPWLFTCWQETIPFPEPVEGNSYKPNPSHKNASRHPELDSGSVLKGPLTATDSGSSPNGGSIKIFWIARKAALPGFLLVGKEEKPFPVLVEGNSPKTNAFDFYGFRVDY